MHTEVHGMQIMELMTLDELPAEILLMICSRLTYRDRIRFKLVCKRCYDVVSDPHLWKEVTWTNFSSSDSVHMNNILHRYVALVTKVVVCGHFQLPQFSLSISKCVSLKVLVILGLRTNLIEIERVVTSLPHLNNLEFEPRNSQCRMERCQHLMCFPNEWRDFLSSVASVQTVTFVIPHTDSIVEFIMHEWASHNYSPTNLNLRILVRKSLRKSWNSQEMNSPYLNSIYLWKSLQYTLPSSEHHACFQIYPYRSLPSFGLKIPPLFELRLKPGIPLSGGLQVARIDDHDDSVGSIHFVETSHDIQSCSSGRLTSVDFSEVSVCRFQDIESHHITYLDFSSTVALLSKHLEAIADACPNLSHLNLSGCVQCFIMLFGMASLMAKCTKLKAFNVQNISSNFIESLTAFWEYIGGFKNLIHLAINLHLFHAASKRDESSEPHVNFEARLQELELLGSDIEQDYSFHPLPTAQVMSEWKTLKHLRIETTVQVSSKVIQSILNSALIHCRSLKCLYVASPFTFHMNPESLASAQLEQIFIMCQRLNISDLVVNSIANSKLTHLYLFVRSVSKESLYTILEKAHSLLSCSIYTRDRPVNRPPDLVLEFRKKFKEVIHQRRPALDDFVYEEDVTSDVMLWVKNATIKSVLNSDLVSIWI